MKINVFQSLFYVLLAGILYASSCFLLRFPEWDPQFVLLAKVVYFFVPFSPWHIPVLFLITLALIIFCIFKGNKILRIFASFFFILLFSVRFSFLDRIPYVYHIWFFASFFFIFIDNQSDINSTRNRLVLRLIQSTLLLQYFSSGLWKVIRLGKNFSLNYFKEIMYENIAGCIAKGLKPISFVINTLIYQYPLLLAFGFLSVLAFQLFSIVPVFKGKYFCFVGCCAVFFHAITKMIMDIAFFPNVMAVIFFLIYVEGVLMKND